MKGGFFAHKILIESNHLVSIETIKFSIETTFDGSFDQNKLNRKNSS